MQDEEGPEPTSKSLLLLGLLASYNKFEIRNPYRIRLEDCGNETVIQRFVIALGASLARSRDHYAAIQEDVPEGWTLSNTLSYIGLGILAPTKQSRQSSNLKAKAIFGDL